MGLLYKILCIVCVVVVFAVTFGSLFIKKRIRDSKSKRPFCDSQLRPAGESLRVAISKADDDLISSALLYLGFVAIAGGLVYGTSAKQMESPHVMVVLGFSLALTFIVIIFFTIKLWRIQQRLWNLTLGYDGECYVGQVLTDTLVPLGCKVFHDLPFDGFNIDHLVVSPYGVFVVETKTRRKPIDGKSGKHEYKVFYDGKRLSFTSGLKDYGALDQTQFNAKEVAKWLNGETGCVVPVCPVLLFPGWFVEMTGNGPVVVTSPRYLVPRIFPNGVACLNNGAEIDEKLYNKILYIVTKRATLEDF